MAGFNNEFLTITYVWACIMIFDLSLGFLLPTGLSENLQDSFQQENLLAEYIDGNRTPQKRSYLFILS